MIDERCGAGVPHPRYLAVLSPPCSGHCGFITHSQIMTQEEEKGGKEKERAKRYNLYVTDIGAKSN